MEAKITIYESDGTTPAFVFEGDDLISCQYEQHSSFTGTELNNDTLTATVRSQNPYTADTLISSEGDYLRSLKADLTGHGDYLVTRAGDGVIGVRRGTPADLLLHDEEEDQDYVYHYVFESVKMISSGYFSLQLISPMAYLGENACGGINTHIGKPSYTNTVGSLTNLFCQRSGYGLTLTVDPDIAGVPVTGIIEESDSIRDAICKLQMVSGACIVNGDTLEPVNEDGTNESIPEDNCGNQTITYPEKNTRIYVNSWYYDDMDVDSEEIYNYNALPDSFLSGSVLDYDIDAPYTKWEMTINPAAVSGLGTQHIIIDTNVDYVGKLTIFKHKFLPVTHDIRSVLSDGITKIVSVDNNKIITASNWQSVAEKLLDFYARAQKHEVTVYEKLLHTNHVYEFTDATGARKTGILTDINVQISHTLASRCTFVVD